MLAQDRKESAHFVVSIYCRGLLLQKLIQLYWKYIRKSISGV